MKTWRRPATGLRSFGGIQARPAPEGFVGTLRPYQREGLGWLNFLRGFGFGGCLADDMGLGKTVQVLALLEARRERARRTSRRAVAGRRAASLVFNWKQEAARFTPRPARARPHRRRSASCATISTTTTWS